MHLKILLFLFLLPAGAKAGPPIRNLVFEGGGIRGIAYAGAIEVLEKRGLTDSLQKIGGTSAGAITALALALHYTGAEVADIVSSTDFAKFNQGRAFFVGGFHRLKTHFGWYRGGKVLQWLHGLIEAKTGDGNITFAQLHARGGPALYITATCLNRQQILLLSHETYPNMRVKDAVRISMSVPLYFEAVFIDSAGKTYPEPAPGLDVVIDGGILANFPIDIFDETQKDSAGFIRRIPNAQTIGVRLDSDEQIARDTSAGGLSPVQINSFSGYMRAFYVILLENGNRAKLTPADWARTVSVSSAGVSPRIKKLSGEVRARLVAGGRESMTRFLSKREG